ncbi:MAG: four helix bundle protein [Armatimonadetes bacterium]|nr:four helix bundle protein [Armatimonadota bacterium]MBS1728141.1 four helix bundle protein [Armatimonadota bacterium]
MIYRVTDQFPREEKFGMTLQLRRAAISVTSNIAEGHGRSTDADFSRFLYMALGSVREMESILEVAIRLSFLRRTDAPIEDLQTVAKMLTGLINKLNGEKSCSLDSSRKQKAEG